MLWKAIPFIYLSVYFLSTRSESTSVPASVEINSLQQIEILRQEELATVLWKIIIFSPIIDTLVGSQLIWTCQQLSLREEVSQFHRVFPMGSFQARLSTYLFWEVSFSLGGIWWERTLWKTPHLNKPHSLDTRSFLREDFSLSWWFCMDSLQIQAVGIVCKVLVFKKKEIFSKIIKRM